MTQLSPAGGSVPQSGGVASHLGSARCPAQQQPPRARGSPGAHGLAAPQLHINKGPNEKGNERLYSNVLQFRVADFCPEIPVSLGHSVLAIFSFVFPRGMRLGSFTQQKSV